jgi:DNA repair exonuclease SbcCD ATPase subunit
MKIKELSIKNFLVIGNAKINLDSRGLVLVQGINLDDTSSNSNGSGKSSIVDAISWCLYGETARGESGDAVVNNKVGKDCHVSVELVDGDNEYMIRRCRKHSLGKNGLTVAHRNLKTEEAGDLTKGTTALTQQLIETIVGCSYDVFVASTYSGQEAMPDLPNMTDKQLKMVIEEAAGIERLQKASEIAVAKRSAEISVSNIVSRDQIATEQAIESLEKDVEVLKGKDAEFKFTNAEKIKSLKADKKALAVKLDGLTKMIRGCGRATLESRLEEIKKEMASAVGTQADKKAQLIAEESRLGSELKYAESRMLEASKLAKDMKKSLDDVSLRVGQPCSECGKEYCEDDIEHAKKAAEEKLKQSLLSLRKTKQSKEQIENALKIAQSERSDFVASMTDVSDLVGRREALESKLKELDKLDNELITVDRQMKECDKSIADTEAEKSPYIDILFEKEELIKSNKVLLDECDAKAKELGANIEKLDAVVDVFGRSGVRAHILDTVTPFLNSKTAEYLGTLTDGNITANWSTISKTAKGELREKFGISVEKENGAKSFRGLSGGEKRKVRLATAMALQDLVANRATKSIEFQLFDEIDDAIDTSGLERLMTILEKRGREKGTVLVISHNDIASWVPSTITVKNTGGISTVDEECL